MSYSTSPCRITYAGDTTLDAAQSVVLFDSQVAFPPKHNLPHLGQTWFSYAIFNTEAGGADSMTGESVADDGTTWTVFYTSGTHGADTTLQDDVYIAGLRDVRFTYLNGAAGSTITVHMALNDTRGGARSDGTMRVNEES